MLYSFLQTYSSVVELHKKVQAKSVTKPPISLGGANTVTQWQNNMDGVTGISIEFTTPQSESDAENKLLIRGFRTRQDHFQSRSIFPQPETPVTESYTLFRTHFQFRILLNAPDYY